MHFSIAMEHPAFWLVGAAMLVGKSSGANDALGARDCRRAASRLFELPAALHVAGAETGSDEFLNSGLAAGKDFASSESCKW
jgi:hypothetical protein